jgi:hypothetical protein
LLLVGLLLLAGPTTAAPVALAPASANEEEEQSSAPTEVALALDATQHARRAVERPRPPGRTHVVLPPRRHHAPAVASLTPPTPFRAAVNPPLHC